jgi:fission process protein 1
LAFGYIATDITVTVAEAKPEERKIVLFDRTLWHSMASLVIPGVTVHQTVKFTSKAVKNMANVHAKRIIPVAVGLGIIPFIVHPIDHFADFVMDKTVRKWY